MLSLYKIYLTEQDDEDEKWAQDADPEEGKMHRLLDVPEGENIEDHYSDGQQLADDLVAATGDESEAASMLAFAANVNDERDVFDDALDAIKKKDYSEEE